MRRKVRLESAMLSMRYSRSARSSLTVASALPSALNANPVTAPW